MARFDGQHVVVTGGGGGIGGATCKRFAQEGAKVTVLDKHLAAAQAVVQQIQAAGGQAQAVACDITERSSVDAAVQAAEQWAPVDVLVNNAGWDVFKPFTKTNEGEWQQLIAINLVGALNLHHALLPKMAERKAGRIVNIASDAARPRDRCGERGAGCAPGRAWRSPGPVHPACWSERP